MLREGIVTSELVDRLSPEAEVFFYRLLVVCDDYGLMDARPAILRARCFPLRESVTAADVEQWLCKLEGAELIRLYVADDKPFLSVNKWAQRQRSTPKYPLPPGDGRTIDSQLPDDCARGSRVEGRGTRVEGRGVRAAPPISGWLPTDQTKETLTTEGFAPYLEQHLVYFRDYVANRRGKPYSDLDAAFRNCVRGDWGEARKAAQREGKINGRPAARSWWEGWPGIVAKGKKYGLSESDYDTPPLFKSAVYAEARKRGELPEGVK